MSLQKNQKMLSTDIIALKKRVKATLQARKYNGDISAYGGSAYDYTVNPSTGTKVLKEHVNKIIVPLNAITPQPEPYNKEVGPDVQMLTKELQYLNANSITYYNETLNVHGNSSCKASCSGLCVNTCSDACTGSCKNDCTTGCSGTCKNTCLDGCQGSCKTQCTNTCTGGCDGYSPCSCEDGCTGGCGGCGNECGQSCTSGCTDGCLGSGGCTGGCSGSCSSGCSGSCSTNCSYYCGSYWP